MNNQQWYLLFLIFDIIGSDIGEIERLRCRKEELEGSVTTLEESLKILLSEQRNLEDEGSKLHKQRVCTRMHCYTICWILNVI